METKKRGIINLNSPQNHRNRTHEVAQLRRLSDVLPSRINFEMELKTVQYTKTMHSQLHSLAYTSIPTPLIKHLVSEFKTKFTLTFLSLLTLFIVFFARPAHVLANNRQKAEKLAVVGQNLFEIGKYSDALKIFKEARSLFNPPQFVLPEVLWNIGRCYEKMKEDMNALAAFKQFLKYSKTADYKAAALKKIKMVSQRLKARVLIIVKPNGTDVVVDGKPIGKTPLDKPLLLIPGQHDFIFKLKGFRTILKTINLKPKESKSVHVTLQRPKGYLYVKSAHGIVGKVKIIVDDKEMYQGDLPATIKIREGKRNVTVLTFEGKQLLMKKFNVYAGSKVNVAVKALPPKTSVVVNPVFKKKTKKNHIAHQHKNITVSSNILSTVSPLKSILFWTGLGSGIAGLGLNLWGYFEWKNAIAGTPTMDTVNSARSSARWKLYTAFGMYGVSVALIASSFFIGKGEHPLGLTLLPIGTEGLVMNFEGKW